MNTATIIISSLAMSQFAFLAAHFLLHHKNTTGRLVVGLSLCTIAYLLNESVNLENGTLMEIILGVMTTLAPFLLWLIASNLFVDEKKQHGIAWAALTACFTLDIVGSMWLSENGQGMAGSVAELVVNFVPQLILLGFPVHAIYLAIRGYRFDLLEERRQFRIAFITGLGTVVVFIVVCDILNDVLQDGLAGGGDPYVIMASFCLFVVALVFNLGSIQTSSSTLKLVTDNAGASSAPEPAREAPEGIDQSLVHAIQSAMEEGQLYKEPGLTIADLAQHVGVLEYKARNTINRSMQHRNFNQFLNSYRIREACRLIRSTRYPVSRIAMDVGYSSLSAFNRAFREHMDTTPSDYRKHNGD